MKVALVHDWLIHMRGGEKVLEAFAELYPDATIYTLIHRREKLSPALQRMKVKTSFLQNIPGIRMFYRWLLPFFPRIIKSFVIDEDTDLVISSSHCVAKGVRIPAKARHISYVHTPMRYLWGFEDEYLGRMPALLKSLVRLILSQLRKWDLASNAHVEAFVANSENVRGRIRKFYNRDAVVIHPPFDSAFFAVQPKEPPAEFYLVVSAFAPYKRVDLVIEAFNELDKPLLVVGSGPMNAYYRKLRQNSKISFLGSVSNQELAKLYSGAKALLFPTDEDFGIVPLEAQACGTPVIAYARGGALESVKHGHFFEEQTPEAIRNAVLEFEEKSFDRAKVRNAVEAFEKKYFKEKFSGFVNGFMNSTSGKVYAAN